MSTLANPPAGLDERLQRLEQQIARKNFWIVGSIVLNLLLVFAGLYLFGFRFGSRTIETRRIIVRNPANRIVAVLGADDKWGGIRRPGFVPGVEFFDENGNENMLLTDTSILFRHEDHKSVLGAVEGLDVSSLNADARVSNYLFSYHKGNTDLLLVPDGDGMKMTLRTGRSSGGIRTQSNAATLFASTPKGEINLFADGQGTRLNKDARPEFDAPTTGMHQAASVSVPSSVTAGHVLCREFDNILRDE